MKPSTIKGIFLYAIIVIFTIPTIGLIPWLLLARLFGYKEPLREWFDIFKMIFKPKDFFGDDNGN